MKSLSNLDRRMIVWMIFALVVLAGALFLLGLDIAEVESMLPS